MKEEILLNKFIYLINSCIDARRIFLFGSRAKGNSSTGADFDFAIDTDIDDRNEIRKIKEKIEEIAGLYSVDLVNLNSVDSDFKNIILETGKLVYEK
ncbi:MAG: nucleotidyltransferase domain-containing protein [Melioribacteraceae bacterium]|nr:nucleotidyltransferase domain-containing protein [Melioribacteraceae bacterium]